MNKTFLLFSLLQEHFLFRRNLCTMTLNFCSFGVAVYFFFRHNWYCETGGILLRSDKSMSKCAKGIGGEGVDRLDGSANKLTREMNKSVFKGATFFIFNQLGSITTQTL